MKRIVGYILTASMLTVLLAGCGNKGEQTQLNELNSNDNSSQPVENTDGSSVINFDEEPYEVVIENLTLGTDMPDLELVEDAVNEITLPQINCTVKILNVHIADHVTKLSLMAAGGEKIDVVTTGRTYSYPTMVADGLLVPLDDLLEERGQGILEKASDMLEGCRVGGSIYSIPGEIHAYTSVGMIYNKDMAEEYGITVPESLTSEDLEKIAAQLKEANPDKYMFTRGPGEQDTFMSMYYPDIIAYGVDAIYGAMDESKPELKIFNLFKSDEFKAYLHKNREWYVNGWVPADSMVSGVNQRDVFTTEQSFCEFGTTSPMQLGIMQPSYDFELGMVSIIDAELSTASVQENGWGISVNCERPDKAMDFLNLMYTNADVNNLLTNGIEGVHYEKVSEHIIRYPEGVNAGNIGYSRIFSNFGDSLQSFQWEPVSEEAFDECLEIAENADVSPIFGFTFDPTPVSTQISNVTNVLAEYKPALVVGIYEDSEIDAQLEKMNKALDAAGMEEIIAEHQHQLDEWLATK